ncbi:fatty acid elongase [Starmerella bacillaris]|uniref:Elongation of fatty acids protein n=1 Tax=Starmerella bacillaris TaxID=1247836 RepID=A0AAV5RMV0_STABA|nr:fatty acid elongase [Starmerella bacillaris]
MADPFADIPIFQVSPFPSSFLAAVDISFPSVDRPFGIYLWPIFRYLVFAIIGYDIETFEYKYNSDVPFSSVPSVVEAIAAYYIIIFGGRWLLTKVRPIRMTWLFRLHNLILTLLSGILLLLLVEQVLPVIIRNGVFYSICSPNSWTQKTELIYYLNYLTKYYELLDTVFMVFRKRPLTFLHTYHHGATAVLCFSQLNGRTPVSYVPISLNLAVHVVMYFYYFLSSCGYRPWWKTWVTRFQIIQFIIDLGFVYFASYTTLIVSCNFNMPNMGACAGRGFAAVYGCLILSSYLVLFISFYIKSYVVPAAARKSKAKALEKQRRESMSGSESTAAATTGASHGTTATKTKKTRRA